MKTGGGRGDRRLWWVVGFVCVLGAGVSWFWINALPSGAPTALIPPQREAAALPSGAIGVTRLDQTGHTTAFQEEATFFDPTPLFLPTQWNATQNALPESVLHRPDQMFGSFPPILLFNQDKLVIAYPAMVKVPGNAEEALGKYALWQPFMGMGQENYEPPKLPARAGFIEVREMATGRLLLAAALQQITPPQTHWQPLQLLAAVNTTGLVGPPSFLVRSGTEAVDDYFQNFLMASYHLGQRVPPGFYRISIGP